MDPSTQQFLVTEFEALRREMDIEIVALRDLIPYALFASSFFWSWLFSKEKKEPLPPGVEFIAPLLSILLCLRAYTISLQIGRIGDYIRLLESKLTLPSGLGWETHFYSLGPSARLDIAVGALWGVIIIANLSLALYRNKKLYKNKIILTLSFILLLLAIISFFNWNNSIIRISILLLGLSTTIFIIHTINKSIIK